MTKASPGPQARPWRPWTICWPASLVSIQAFVFATAGAFAVGFGLASSCTDKFSCGDPCAPCATLYGWLRANTIGQWALVAAGFLLLAFGLHRPARRRAAAITAWVLVPFPFLLIALTTVVGGNSF